MINYSAAQAISPAIERTKQFLFQPFRVGRFLKLTLVAALVEGVGASFGYNSGFTSGGNLGPLNQPFHVHPFQFPAVVALVGIVLAFAILAVPVCILIAYLLIRLRFAFFDCLLRMQDRIAPAWRLYHRQAMRYLGMTICVSLVFLALVAGIGYKVYLDFKPLFDSFHEGGDHTFSDFLPLIATVFPLAFLLTLLSFLVETALRAFILPHMALEDSSIAESLSDVWVNVLEKPGQFALFVLLRGLLSLVAQIAGSILLMIPLIIVVGICALIVAIFVAFSKVAAIVVGVLLGALVAAAFILACIAVVGTIGTFRRSYAMFFYAGSYPPLSALLESSIPVPQARHPAAPPWPPAAYPGTPQGS